MKKPKTPVVPKQFELTPEHIHHLRGLLIAKERRDITWSEFANVLGIARRQLIYLMAGERRPGRKTFDGIMDLRDRGVMVHMSDFEVKTPTP